MQGFLNGIQTFEFIDYMYNDMACNSANRGVIILFIGSIKSKPAQLELLRMKLNTATVFTFILCSSRQDVKFGTCLEFQYPS